MMITTALVLVLSTSSNALMPSVVIAPAQFGVPKDYDGVKKQLLERGHPKVEVAQLTRLDWLRITPSILKEEFWTGNLTPTPTLDFFYEGLDAAFEEVTGDVAIVGHSIGGWVARAYVAEKSRNVAKIVTLGTPHLASENGVDQTRGLVDYINANYPADSRMCCVVGNTSTAMSLNDLLQKEPWTGERSPLLESLVALPSYAVIAGEFQDPFSLRGDGLIPIDAALLPGTQRLILPECHHSGFIPTALDSIQLPDSYQWYGSPSMLAQWADFLIR